MAYTLEALAKDCHAALINGETPEALQAVCGHVKQALGDALFLDKNILNRPFHQEREVIYEDPDLGFCICAHVYGEAKPGAPHDHGPTWAIYGQAEGETEMTDWEVVCLAKGDEAARVKESTRYTLVPGDAHVYPTGAVHAPIRYGATRLLRIEGTNTDRIRRTKIKPA